jgi:hypothetical protein
MSGDHSSVASASTASDHYLCTTDIAEPEKTARETRPRLLVSQTGPGLDVGYDCLCFGDLGKRGLTRTPLSSTPRGACGPIAGAAEKGVLGELEWRPSLSRSRVTADALDHGAHAVRALWRKMLLEAQPAKSAQGVDGENLLRRAIGEYRDRDRD